MKNGTASTCFGQFFDSGGSDGYYNGGEDEVFILKSGEEDALLELRFVEFSLSGQDWLAIYDGNSIESTLVGKYSAGSPVPFNVKASGGSLTFVFHSDKESSGPGWRAKIVCMKNGQKINRESPVTGKYILKYSISGLRSAKDARLMESNLTENEMIPSIKVSFKNSIVWVGTEDESLSGVIAEIIASSEEFLGYPVQIVFKQSFRSKENN